MFHYSKSDLKDILYVTLFQTLFLMLNFSTKNKKYWAFYKQSVLNLVAGGPESAANIFCGVHK